MAGSWRLAKSLEKLRAQINGAFPNRSKASDGTIGDAAHAGTASDHNPNAQGVVCALDITHDPANGCDAHAIAESLLANRHPNLKYLISNKRIAGAWTGWKWAAYAGSNPHSSHVHVSVGVGADGQSQAGTYDDETKWNIGGSMAKVTLDVARCLAYLIGRDGRDGRTNARTGGSDADLEKHHVGQELTPEYIFGWMNSKEHSTHIKRIDALYKERDALKARVKELEAQPSGEFVKLSDIYVKK